MTELAIEHVEVGVACVEALVRVLDLTHSRTSAMTGLAEAVLELLPGVRRHSCENGSAHGIAAELSDTELPHLLEHITFELMALSGSPRTLKGETAWNFSADGVGVYRVRLAYDDDLVALGALKAAAGIVEWLAASCAADDGDGKHRVRPDIDAVVESLRMLRSRS